MANQTHVDMLQKGNKAWNAWRKQSTERPDLSEANLMGINLTRYHLDKADLRGAILIRSEFRSARLNGADLSGANARFAVFSGAKLSGAILKETDLRAASLRRADLSGANLEGAILRFASMVGANVKDANFQRAEVYGLSSWNLKGEPAHQTELVIREETGAVATSVDDIDTAQFLHMLRDNAKIADVIDTASKRTVLILGRFNKPNKNVLDALKAHLLAQNWVPILFDFDRPDSRDLTETVAILAHMTCFVIADLSGAKSIPQELSFIVPYLPSVPVVPLLRSRNKMYAMFGHFKRYPWVQETVHYKSVEDLLSRMDKEVVEVGFNAAMKARGIHNAEMPRPLGL